MSGRLFAPRFADLPSPVGIFPLPGALLLPGGHLPLTIFEPRYLALVQDALGRGRMFAMIQPREGEPTAGAPVLYDVACLGRIISFSETPDGRLEITLLGVCRLRVTGEEAPQDGYRRVRAAYDAYAADLEPPAPSLFSPDERTAFLADLKAYAATIGLSFDWRVIAEIPDAALVTSLAMACPFEPREKQALLEAPTPQDRARLLSGLMEIGAAGPSDGGRLQ